jgi:hypothetical protein
MKTPKFKEGLPTKIDFGFGFIVKIREECLPHSGQWLGIEKMLIEINAHMPIWRKYEILGHEVMHAALDFFQWVRDEGSDPLYRDSLQAQVQELLEEGEDGESLPHVKEW